MGKRRDPALAALEEHVIGDSHGRPQRTQGKRSRFTAKRRQRFMDALALCCNVRMAAAYAGVSDSNVYYWRARDPVFKDQWREALELGLERLEMQVVEHGGAGLPLEPADPERAVGEGFIPPPFDFAKATEVLRLYAKTRAHFDHRSDARVRSATAGETDAAIIDLLRRMRGRTGAPAALLPAPAPAADET